MLGRVRCPKCGKGVSRERMYCPHCNANLHTNYWPSNVVQKVPERVEAVPKPIRPPEPKEVKARPTSVFISVVVALIVVGVFVFAAFLLMSSPPMNELLDSDSFSVKVKVINDRPDRTNVEVKVKSGGESYTETAMLSSGQWENFGTFRFTFDKDSYEVKNDLPVMLYITCYDEKANDTTANAYYVDLAGNYEVTLHLSDWSWSIS